ncbi:ABC transporter permease [Oerskovia turbata]|uniref:ABC transporter permease n=1 Tax=Oerskovia turbata TaxID=1713 RepID=A0A4Q1KZW9_9CELL|nr:ABC transporter permease [Oerskovia turbata]RXR28059.1 ABC transporter permease [Oerskovia turbata]RXR35932.1 ABC transporter permease [Oerskovia turbata]TGJ94846.1 ABC transporter permease [Actinotalea fermentans ATCC 43279 = JCM 9966 = DSM 3133]
MTTLAPTSTRTPGAPAATRTASGVVSSLRRIGSLVRAESLLLVRNRTALFNGVLLAPAMVAFLHFSGAFGAFVGDDAGASTIGAFALTSLICFALMFVVYYNLASAYVARREELVLKRLRTGQCSDGEILAGAATPAVVTMLGQLVLGGAAIALWIGLDAPANVLLLLVAVLAGAFVFTALAAASTAFTRTVETAQLSTLPVMALALLLSGTTLPLTMLPERVQVLAELTPLHPVAELLTIGLTGLGPDGVAVGFGETFALAAAPLAVLAGWCVLGAWLATRYMRWEPRR